MMKTIVAKLKMDRCYLSMQERNESTTPQTLLELGLLEGSDEEVIPNESYQRFTVQSRTLAGNGNT